MRRGTTVAIWTGIIVSGLVEIPLGQAGGRRSGMTPEAAVTEFLKFSSEKAETKFQFIVEDRCSLTGGYYDADKQRLVEGESEHPWGESWDKEGLPCLTCVGGEWRWVIAGFQVSSSTVVGLGATVPVVFKVLGKEEGAKLTFDPHYRTLNFYLARPRSGWVIYYPHCPELEEFRSKDFLRDQLQAAARGKYKLGTYASLIRIDHDPAEVRELLGQLEGWSWPEGKPLRVVEDVDRKEVVENSAPCWLIPAHPNCQEWLRKRGPRAYEPP